MKLWDLVAPLISRSLKALEDAVNSLLAETLFKARPELATQFSGPISMLVTLTALYLLLTFVSAARKAIGVLLAIGWSLLALAIILASI